MESTPASNFNAFIAYIPVIGWIYALLFQRKDEFVMFHLRQSIGLFVFLAAMLLGWMVITWIISWIPFGMLVGVMLFTIVLAAFIYSVFIWIAGMMHALQGRVVLLPIFGRLANRFPL